MIMQRSVVHTASNRIIACVGGLAVAVATPVLGEPMTPEEAAALMAEEVEARPAPFVGQKAPDLRVDGWLQGTPVTEFQPGETYVIEMWATWCAPCIALIPHLNKLHLDYQADENHSVTFVGMNILDRRRDETETEQIARLEQFISERNGEMTYRVAYEEGQLMNETWMEPAGQRGLPAAFIVDGTGHIAWVGNPAVIDDPLEQTVRGEHDLENAKLLQIGQVVLNETLDAMEQGDDVEGGLARLEALTLTSFKEDPEARARIGFLVSRMDTTGEAGREWALRIAKAAVDASAMPFAMFGHVQEANGDFEGAVESMRQAVELNEDETLEEFFSREVSRLDALVNER
ncbi:MAG: TlpA disulfide reductase family protein [Planctomycetota bacterium]